MGLVIDIFLTLVSHLPKLVSWWLYSSKRTKGKVEVSISAREGSVEVWCNKAQAKLSLWVQFKNNNPFPIEIDRVEALASFYTAQMKATNLFGIRLKRGGSDSLHIEGKIDDVNLKRVNESSEDRGMRVEIQAVVVNKYNTIRDFRVYLENMMCRLVNKNIKQNA